MKRNDLLLFVGLALVVAGLGVIASPLYKNTATSFTTAVKSKSSEKYGILYTLRHSVGEKFSTADGHYYAVVLNTDFLKAVTSPVIAVGNETYPVTGKVAYVDDAFLETGNGYVFLKLTTTGGTAGIVARATLKGNLVNVEPLYGVLKTGKRKLYLVAVPGSGFSFIPYDRITVSISPFFKDGEPVDPQTGEPLSLI